MNLTEADQLFLKEVKRRQPEKRSDCGALLSEMEAAANPLDRARSAFVFQMLECRRGFRRLEKMVGDLVPDLEMADPGLGSDQRKLLSALLNAIGGMDIVQSHALLVRLLREASTPWLRAAVLEAMAYEKGYFDFSCVLPFVSEQADPSEILSALYALELHDYANAKPTDAQQRIVPLFRHKHPMVRMYSVRALSFRSSNRSLILPLLDDPDRDVRQEALLATQNNGSAEEP